MAMAKAAVLDRPLGTSGRSGRGPAAPTRVPFADVSGILRPASIAVIGASDRPGNLGGDTVRHLVRFGYPGPVRKSIAAEPVFQQYRFFKLAAASAATWWRPPFSHKHWANYQDKIAPYWQQALRQEISVKDFHVRAAKFLRGEA